MKVPKAIQNLIEAFEKLPGIGPKTAQRLTFYLLHVPQGELDQFSNSVQSLKTGTIICSICFAVDESDPCSICADFARNKSIICVVGEGIKNILGIAGGIFTILSKNNIHIEMISMGASEINLTFIVDSKDTEKAVKVLHEGCFE